MELFKIILNVIFIELVNTLSINDKELKNNTNNEIEEKPNPDNVFNGVYTECFLHLSYSCLQKKTLLYLKELNNLSEVSVLGDYVKFVKVNTTTVSEEKDPDTGNAEDLAFLIDKAVDDFFDNHVLKFNALGRDISLPRNMEVFVGRKKRKGGGGVHMMMGGHGHDDKKKMMMMAMMCMKMKLMMMVPAMMGMMGMMSFKGMMFSMMSFMISKMMLLMKILEKRGAAGLGGSGGGGDGGWAAAAGGGGAWMPAGQDLSGGGYDANGQWQSRSIAETLDIINKPTIYNDINKYTNPFISNKADKNQFNSLAVKTVLKTPDFKAMPEISYVKPIISFNNKIEQEIAKSPILAYKKSNVIFNNYGTEISDKVGDVQNDLNFSNGFERAKRSITDQTDEVLDKNNGKTNDKKTVEIPDEMSKIKIFSRKKRSILDIIKNSYTYWVTTLLGLNNNRRTNFQKYKIINGVPYVYYPFKALKTKTPKEVQLNSIRYNFKPIITADDFNKGEIMEGGVEARMHRKKFTKMKDTVNDTLEDDPWQ